MTHCQRLAITSGEPAGIGPDLCLHLAKQHHRCQLLVIADPKVLELRAKQLGMDITLHLIELEIDQVLAGQTVELPAAQPSKQGELYVLPLACDAPVVAGQLKEANAQYVLTMLTLAAKGALAHLWDGIVTGPVHKGIINQAGQAFSGHTEYFRDICGVPEVVMMLATLDLRVALVTTHLPLRDVADAITKDRVQRVSRILHQDLRQFFGIAQPRILVAGLNPHAGEGGHLGDEEITIIEPALEELRNEGLDLQGPLPADTLYTEKYLANADATLAMFHDQGLPVLKFHGFGRAANITLGMPIIRTSVDHGTALDLAGTGKIDPGSLMTAVQVAEQMASRRQTAHG